MDAAVEPGLIIFPLCTVICGLQWSPTIPGVFSASLCDGKVAISNVLDCTSAAVEVINADFSVTHTKGVRGRQRQHLQHPLPSGGSNVCLQSYTFAATSAASGVFAHLLQSGW